MGVVFAVAGCSGRMSWLEGAGREGAAVISLIWPMWIGAAVVWLVVVGLAIYATRIDAGPHSERNARRLILWGGVALPTVAVLALLLAGLFVMRDISRAEPSMRVEVDGEQWWWRVRYLRDDAPPVVSANEIRLPRGRTVEFVLTSDDVIHSFWIPALGGKLDMIPGRTNRLALTPERTGEWRGVCAEYCGGAHAQMAFAVVVMEPEDFDRWLAAEARDAAAPADPAGLDAFLAAGCGACHAIRGTEADGRVGPDLTHVGGRETLGAGIAPMDAESLFRWIARTGSVKPGVRMPAYPMLPANEVVAIARYLEGLE